MPSFKSKVDELTALTGEHYSFQGATLTAEHPIPGAVNNEVATTGWVQSLLGTVPLRPVVSTTGGLKVEISGGIVEGPSGVIPVSALSSLAVNGNSIEYIWVRFLDSSILASTTLPSPQAGELLATVYTDATSILAIIPNGSSTGYAPLHNPVFTGDPKVPTPPLGDNDLSVANTAWVRNELLSLAMGEAFPRVSATPSVVSWTLGSVRIEGVEYSVASGSRTLTPPPSSGSLGVYAIRPSIGTEASVEVRTTPPSLGANVLLGVVVFGEAPTVTPPPLPSGGFAPINSPVFTGIPLAPTPLLGEHSNRIATTEWVLEVIPTRMGSGFGGYIEYI